MTHECDGVKEYVGYNVIEHSDGDWLLHIDCHCCSTVIKWCPYCGLELARSAIDSTE